MRELPRPSRFHAARAVRSVMLCLPLALAGAAEDPPLWSGTLEVGASHAQPVSTSDSDLAVDEALAEARTYWQPRLGIRLGLGVGGSYQRYDGEPLSTSGDSVWLRLPATVMWSEHWGFTSLSSVGSSTAPGVPFNDGRRWQVQAGVLWVRDADLLIATSLVVNFRLERGPLIFPLVSLFWRIDEAWSLTVVDEMDNISRLTRTFDEQWAASLMIDARFFEFALPGQDGGPAVFDDDRAIIGLEGAWRPWRNARLAVRPFIGAVVARHIALLDDQGEQLSSTWIPPAPVAGLSLRADF